MATFTWRGGHGTGSDPNDATVLANWLNSNATVATSLPGNGATAIMPNGSNPLDMPAGATLNSPNFIVGTNDTVNLTSDFIDGGTLTGGTGVTLNVFDTTISNMTLELASGTTLNLSGDTQQTGTLIDQNSGTAYETLDGTAITGGSNIVQSGAGSSLVINAAGNVDSDANLIAVSPGGSLTLNAAPLGSIPGVLTLTSGVIGLGESIVVGSTGNAGVANNAELIAATGVLTITGNMLPVSGAIFLAGTSTADIVSGLPGPQTVYFSGANEVLKIENSGTVLQKFGAALAAFATGDTIELVGLTGLSASYADGALTISQGSTVEGAIAFVGSEALDSALGSDGFTLTSSGGNTFITTAATNDKVAAVTAGTTADWGTGATWSGGVPGSTSVADIALTTTEIQAFLAGQMPSYTLLVNSAETTGSVVFSDPLATLLIAAPLTLQTAGAGATSGGQFDNPDGTVDIASGGSLSATQFLAPVHGKLTVAAGGRLSLSGLSTDGAAKGFGALEIENNAIVDGTVAAAGFAEIGRNAPQGANLTLENGGSFTDSYAVLGGRAFGQAYVDITGAGTIWRDAGDSANPNDTGTYLGDMIVGGGDLNSQGTVPLSNVAENGKGWLSIDQGATVQETGSAVLGMTGIGAGSSLNSSGNVSVQNAATWDIAGQLEVGGSHLYSAAGEFGGNGQLSVQSGARVVLGGSETAGQYKVALGYSAGSSGSIDVGDGSGLSAVLDAGGGPVVVGEAGTSFLTAIVGGTIDDIAANATAGFGWGTMLGDQAGSSGVLTVAGGKFTASGDMVVGNAGAGSVEVASGFFVLGGSMYIGGTAAGAGGGFGAVNLLNLSFQSTTIDGNVQVYPGSTLTVGNAGLEIGTTGGAAASTLTVDAGHTLGVAGTLQLDGIGIDNTGTIVAEGSGQTLDLPQNATLSGAGVYQIDAGATLRIDSNPPSLNVAFAAGNGSAAETVILNNPNGTDTLTGFYGSDRVDLPNLNYAGESPSVHYTPNANPATGGTVTISSGSSPIAFVTIPDFHPHGFTLQADVSGGTLLQANDSAPCFAEGTRIATPRGLIAVEALRMGDEVCLAGGGTAPVTWLGHRRVVCRLHPRPWDVQPVLVEADAFGPGEPTRALRLSPDHAVFVDGALIPIRYLQNGRTVRQLTVTAVTYWHTELDRHAVLLAENLPCESYLDTGNRAAFANGGRVVQSVPEFARAVWQSQGCAPLVMSGPRLATAKTRLLARLPSRGFTVTTDPAFRLRLDGMSVESTWHGTACRLLLPLGARRLTVRSRIARPSDLDPCSDDTRDLGAALLRLRLDGLEVALDDPRLVAGWLPPEGDLRWSDGAGEIDVRGVSGVEMSFGAWHRYLLANNTSAVARTG